MMKRIFGALILAVSLLFAPQVKASSAVSATLSLPHNNVLPGVPFDLVVTYTNVSNQSVDIDVALATLVVTFANGETIVMDQPEGGDHWEVKGFVPTHLERGQSVQHAASWDYGSVPNWFRYGSFSGPGSYGIALDLRIEDTKGRTLGTVRTPTVNLTRIDPVGIDGELWKRMQEVSGGRWSDNSFITTRDGVSLADEIIRSHPTSGYYPYVLALRAFRPREKGETHIPLLLEAAERFPDSPAYPYLLSAAADCARYAGLVAEREGNLVQAKEYLSMAETKLREALATKSVAIRNSSERGLEHVQAGLKRTKTRLE